MFSPVTTAVHLFSSRLFHNSIYSPRTFVLVFARGLLKTACDFLYVVLWKTDATKGQLRPAKTPAASQASAHVHYTRSPLNPISNTLIACTFTL